MSFALLPCYSHPNCNVLRDNQTDRGNLHVDGSPHVIRLRRTTLWHFDAGSGRRPPHQNPEITAADIAGRLLIEAFRASRSHVTDHHRLPVARRLTLGSHRARQWPLGTRCCVHAKSQGARASDLNGSFAAAGCGVAGNCNTVARWPSHRRVSSTTCPSENSKAS